MADLYRRRLYEGWLRQQYVVRGRSVVDIAAAAAAGCSTWAVYAALRRHGIPLRGRYRGPRPTWVDVLTPEYLRDAYLARMLDSDAVAAEVGCSKSSVLRALHRHGIRARPPVPLVREVYDWSPVTDAPTDTAAGAAAGATQSSASRARRRRGVPSRTGRPRADDVDMDEVMRRVEAGERLPDVARAVGVAYRVLWNRVKRRSG